MVSRTELEGPILKGPGRRLSEHRARNICVQHLFVYLSPPSPVDSFFPRLSLRSQMRLFAALPHLFAAVTIFTSIIKLLLVVLVVKSSILLSMMLPLSPFIKLLHRIMQDMIKSKDPGHPTC